MGSKKEKKEKKEKRKRKHRSQERSRSKSRDRSLSKSRERKHKKDRKHERYDEAPESKRRREDIQPPASPTNEFKQERGSPIRAKAEPSEAAPPASGSAGGYITLSIEETNKLRAKLGLKPLSGTDATSATDSKTKKEAVHVPAENIGSKKRQEALREKLAAAKEKRQVGKKLGKVRGLGNSDSEDDALAWVERSRQKQKEREMAEKTARMLEQMDEEFGIGDLVEKELGVKKEYTSADLRGLKVEHAQDSFADGRTTILTLKDRGVLEEGDDTLMNVNIVDEEKAAVNVQNKKGLPGYQPYDEGDTDEFGMLKPKDILEKYNEEIHGKKKEQFQLGAGGKYDAQHEKRMQEIRSEIQQQGVTLKLPEPQIAKEFYTPEEMSFKKVTKKVRKIRKKNKLLTVDDLLPLLDDSAAADGEVTDLGNRRNRRRRQQQEEGELVEEPVVKEEPAIPGLDLVTVTPADIITDDTEAPEEDLSGVVVEEDGAALELQLALNKTRNLMSKKNRTNQLEKIAETIKVKEEEMDSEEEPGPVGRSIILNGTSEFCRTLGDIPTYGQAGNRAEEEEDELLDFERELAEQRRLLEAGEDTGAAPGWQEVEVVDAAPMELETTEDVRVMDDEPVLNSGLAAALNLAVKKGFLEKEKEKLINKSSKTNLDATNYSIEDKRLDDLDDKYSRRGARGGGDRYAGSGAITDFSEKRGYKPDIMLEYFDEKGHKMNEKEAFRYLSHRFHGKGSGKLKTEKRKKKLDQEKVMKSMSSTDTPLNTASMLEGRLKQEQAPFLVLSGSNKTAASTLKKS